jgi:hypothetical protein
MFSSSLLDTLKGSLHIFEVGRVEHKVVCFMNTRVIYISQVIPKFIKNMCVKKKEQTVIGKME